MGAWGYGPFDSDGGLDAFGYLENVSGAQRGTDRELIDGSADQTVMVTSVRRLLTTGMFEDEDYCDQHAMYAAAGLVAAVLTDAPADNSGTRLIATIEAGLTGESNDNPAYGDPMLGLGTHCGAIVLLTEQTAQALLPDAITAVNTLLADTQWHDEFREPDRMTGNLARMRDLLAATSLALSGS